MRFCNGKRGSGNYRAIVHQASAFYLYMMSAFLKQLPNCREALGLITSLEQLVAASNPDVFEDALRHRFKTAYFLRLMRKTNYKSYWLLKLLPR